MLFGDKTKHGVISYSYTKRGGMQACHYLYSVKKTERGAHIVIEESDYYELPVKAREYDVSGEVLDSITEIASKYGMHGWLNLRQSDVRVFDAPSIYSSLTYDNGVNVTYDRHRDILPGGGYAADEEIIKCIESYCKNENSRFELKNPTVSGMTESVSCADGYLLLRIHYESEEPVLYSDEYSVYSSDDELLYYHERTERASYEEYTFRKGFAYEVLIDLNKCANLAAGDYYVEIMGERTYFTLTERKA